MQSSTRGDVVPSVAVRPVNGHRKGSTADDGREQPSLEITLPDSDEEMSQDHEWCQIRLGNGKQRRLRFHDYDEVFTVPGLYERLFYDLLKCRSPSTIRQMLEDVMKDAGLVAEDLRVLELGAGNGMVAEELSRLGAHRIVGVDILDAAAEAAERDRPGLYDDYIVTDMTQLSDRQRDRLRTFDFNCLTCVAALGFGDIPPDAFIEAYNLVIDGGLVAFNIKEEFVNGHDASGFADLIKTMCGDAIVDIRKRLRYRHRLSIGGEPLYYVAMVGFKRKDIER